MNPKDIGNRIYSLIKKKGITAKELSRCTGIKESALTGYKKGEYAPSAEAIINISEFFEVTTNWLLKGDGEMNESAPPQQPHKNSLPARAAPMGEPLTDDQKELLSYFDKMNDISKGRLLEKAEVLAGAQEKEVDRKVGSITPKDTEASKELFFSHSDEVLAVNKDDLLKSKRQPGEILH